MIFYKDGNWHLCSEKVKYIQHGEEITQLISHEGHEWWIDFEEKWEHTEIIEFIEIEHTQGQADRLEEVNQLSISDGFAGVLSDYVMNDRFPSEFNHVLKWLQVRKEQIEQDNYLIDLDFRQSLTEMGVGVNDL